MEDIFKKLSLGRKKVNIDGEQFTELWFADDVALITWTVKDMETKLNDPKVGLKIYKGKTKYMSNFKTDETIQDEDQEIDLSTYIIIKGV